MKNRIFIKQNFEAQNSAFLFGGAPETGAQFSASSASGSKQGQYIVEMLWEGVV